MAKTLRNHKILYELAQSVLADNADANSSKQAPGEKSSGVFAFIDPCDIRLGPDALDLSSRDSKDKPSYFDPRFICPVFSVKKLGYV